MFEAYKVGVTIALTNHISRGLGLIVRDLARTDAQATKLRNTLHGMEKLAIGGAITGSLGYAGFKALGAMVKPAEEYVHQIELAKAKMANLSPEKAQLELAKMTNAAWQTGNQVLTSRATGNLKAVQELRTVLGDTDRAVAALPAMMKLEAVLGSSLHGEKGVAGRDVAFTAAKSLEIRGASNDPARFIREMDLITQATLSSGGRYNPQMQLQVQKYLKGTLGSTLSDEFLYGVAPTLAQEMGGSQLGNALTSLGRAVVRGTIDKKALPIWKQYGLVDSVKGLTGETAMIVGRNAGLMQTDPGKYAQFVIDQLISHGVTDPLKRSQIIDQMFSNRNAGNAFNILATQQQRLLKDMELIRQAGGVGVYDQLIKSDPAMARDAAAAQWDNIMTVLGLRVVPILIPAIHKLADGLQTLTRWAERNPKVVSALVYGLAGLSAALAFSGTVMLLKAGFMGLSTVIGLAGGSGLIGGVGSLAVALGPLGLAGALVAAAGATAAYHQEIANWIDSTETGRKIGDKMLAVKDWLNEGDGDMSAVKRLRVAPPANRTPIHTTVNIDGRKVAEAVNTHQTKAMSSPLASSNLFDTRQTPAPVGGTW